MQVIGHEPHFWFLLEAEGCHFIDVNCNLSSTGFSTMVKLNEAEEAQFRDQGRAFAEQMAKTISDDPFAFTARHMGNDELGSLAHLSITQWMDANRADGWPPRL